MYFPRVSTRRTVRQARPELHRRGELLAAADELRDHLGALTSFWRTRALDPAGGYRTCFDEGGEPVAEDAKLLLSHARLVWTFSHLATVTGDAALLDLARHGVAHLVAHFRDRRHGGWFWKVGPDGAVLDPVKLVYGQSFVIYALAAHARAGGSAAALADALDTFDELQIHASDAAHGGYLENLGEAWTPLR